MWNLREWLQRLVFAIYHIVSILVQGEILATKSKKCYSERVVFFIYRNMADLNHKEVPDTKQSNPEAQSRINEVATKAIRIIENNPKIEEILRDSLKKNILDAILKNPMMVQSVLDEVDSRFKRKLDNMPASERLKAIK